MPPRLFSTAYANARSSPNPNLSSTATNTSPSSAPTLAVRRRHRTLLFRRRRRVLLLVPACRRAPSPALHYSTMLAASPPSLRRGRSDPCSTPASLASNAVAPGKCGGGGDASDGGSVAPMVELKAGSGLSSDRIGSWRSGERAMLREREYFSFVWRGEYHDAHYASPPPRVLEPHRRASLPRRGCRTSPCLARYTE
jgi:hypothetical protein